MRLRTSKVAKDARRTAYRAGTAADEVMDKVRPALDGAVELAHDALDNASDAAASASRWAQKKSKGVRAAGAKLVEDTAGYLGSQPVKSVAIAVVAGILIGRLL